MFLRAFARRLFGITRAPTYYLPWVTRPGLECVLLLSNIEARFKAGFNEGPFPVSVTQHDADGSIVRRYELSLADCTDAAELPLEPTAAGFGFVTVGADRIHSDLYVTLSDGDLYTATHGRQEFVETYPPLARWLLGALVVLAALGGRTVATFRRDQYAYAGPDHRAHLLLMNLSNVENRLRAVVSREGSGRAVRLLRVPPMGAHLLDVTALLPSSSAQTTVWRVRLEGNAWFNLYLLGAGAGGLAGPLSLMHVK